MHCLLVIPAALVHRREFIETARHLDTPALARFLARARLTEDSWPGLADWLLERFELARDDERDDHDVPSAPFACLGEGIDPGADWWAHAAPVNLKPDRDRLLLADASRFQIQEAEARAMVASLNAHFGAGLEFFVAAPDRWYARLASRPKGPAVPLYEVAGRAVEPGRGGMAWHALMNETQMVLHEHPVNESREARGEPPINGVWLWGAGKLQEARATLKSLNSDLPLARGLAQAAGIPTHPPYETAPAWLRANAREGVHLRIENRLMEAELAGNLRTWQTAFEALEREWVAPLVSALQDETIGMLTLVLAGDGKQLIAEATRHDLKRFWRRAKPLSHWLALDESEAA